MRKILGFLEEYTIAVSKTAFLFTVLILSLLIYLNYTAGIESRIRALDGQHLVVAGFFLLYAFTFGISYWLSLYFSRQPLPGSSFFLFLIFIAPLLFALKNGLHFPGWITKNLNYPWDRYWPLVLDWPLKSFLLFIIIHFIWLKGKYEGAVAGSGKAGQNMRPYYLLLCMMIPILIIATYIPSFEQVYPKVKSIAFMDNQVNHPLPWKLLYELAYGVDFFTIEFFFRGFLVLAFARYAGKLGILPMAAFYCTIHFGKPLPECITSFFGGLILGAIVYHTRSIRGGLIIHLGIAWLMELAGYIRFR